MRHDSLQESSLSSWMVHGADTRARLDEASGLNKYGAAMSPREAMALGSCTCSSPSPRAMAAARGARARLERAGPGALAGHLEQVRRRLRRAFAGGAPEVQVVLMPSGTDVEYVPLALGLVQQPRPVVNLVVAPGGVGSGTPLAASGRYFNTWTPAGRGRERGEPLHRDFGARARTVTIAVRDEAGEPRPLEVIDADILEQTQRAVEGGGAVILHHVAHCKTGARAPSLGVLEELAAQLAPHVQVVVDAAQGRLAPRSVRGFLERGWMVSVTGSKFFGGPPFSGALLLPHTSPWAQPEGRALEQLPELLGEFVSAPLVPSSWRQGGWPKRQPLGLALRWAGALAEIESFLALEPGARAEVITSFAAQVPAALREVPGVECLEAPPGAHLPEARDPLEVCPTVFTFRVRDLDGRAWDKARLLELHTHLNTHGPEIFHLGQPAPLGRGGHGLRVALGAPLAIELAGGGAPGQTLEARLSWLGRRLDALAGALERAISTSSPQEPR